MHVVTKFDIGGAQETALALCRLLSPEFNVLLVGGPIEPGDDDIRRRADATAIPTALLPHLARPIRPVSDLRAVVGLYRTMRAQRPAIVHTHSSKAGFLGRLAAWAARVPVRVHTVHGWSFTPEQPPWLRKLYVLLERLAARVSTAVVVVTDLDRQKGLAAGIGRPAQYVVIRSGIRLDDFAPGDRTLARHRLAVGGAGTAAVVGSVTRLSVQKDPHTLVDVLAMVTSERRAVGVVVGGGPLAGAVEERRARVGGDVRLLGRRDDVAHLLPAFDVFLLTSRWEGLPRALVQAMAVGVPVVATKVDGVVDVVEDGVTGLLAEPGDVEGLARAICRLLDAPEEARRMADEAASRVATFGEGEMAERTAELYRRLFAGVTAHRNRRGRLRRMHPNPSGP